MVRVCRFVRHVAPVVLLILALALGACSPEASRTRGGGPGGDIGNRGAAVELRPTGPRVIYYNTPRPGTASGLAGMPIE